MNLSNYMSSIVSEVQQLGKAYVDSFVSHDYDGERKDHNVTSDDPKVQGGEGKGKERKFSGTTASPFFTTIHKASHVDMGGVGEGDDEHAVCEKNTAAKLTTTTTTNNNNNNNNNNNRRASSSSALSTSKPMSTSSLHDDSYSVGASVANVQFLDNASTRPTGTETVKEVGVTSLRKQHAQKKTGKVSRSRFGAVKMNDAEQTAMVTTTTGSISPSVVKQTLNYVGSSARATENESYSKSPLDSPAVKTVLGDNNNGEEDRTMMMMRIHQERMQKQEKIMHLLRNSIQQRTLPVSSELAHRVISHFAMNIAGKALLSTAKESTEITKKSLSSSYSLDVPSEDTWRSAEMQIRCLVSRAIPAELFGPFGSSYSSDGGGDNDNNNNNNNNLGFSGDVMDSLSLRGLPLREGFSKSLLAAKQHVLHHHSPLPLLPSSMFASVDDSYVSMFLRSWCSSLLLHDASLHGNKEEKNMEEEEEKREIGRSIIHGWVKEMMTMFSGVIMKSEVKLGQTMTAADNVDTLELPDDDVENIVNEGTSALWIVREAIVLTLLLVLWAF